MEKKRDDRVDLQELTRTAMMSAVLCVMGPVTVPVPLSPVPLSLIQLGIFLSVYILGRKRGTLSVIIYIMIGAAGLPVFSGFSGGIQKIMGPTGGYLFGYVFMAYAAGTVLEKTEGREFLTLAGLILSNVLCYIPGSLWLSSQMSLPVSEAFLLGAVPYIPLDFLKTLFIARFGPVARRELEKRNLI